MIRHLLACCWLVFLLLSSCMMGPDFQPPVPDLPATWQGNAKPPHSDTAALKEWWQNFQDPQLIRMIDLAFKANPDMRNAILRIREARERLRITESTLFPALDVNAGWGLSPRGGFRAPSVQQFSLRPNVSWEPDLFGGNRRSVEAVQATLSATYAGAGAVQTALSADIATTYFDWIGACEQLRIAQEQLAIQRNTLTIAQKRYQSDFAPRLDVEQAISNVAATESRIPALHAQVASAKNRLATLLGTYNAWVELKMPAAKTFMHIPGVPVGLPSELLRRRPDIIAAEEELHAATANIGVAVADLYPRFSLTGAINASAGDFSDLFRENNNAWSLGANLTQPIFHAGSLRAAVRAQRIAAEQAGENYRKALITAVADVEDALITYGNYTAQLQFLEKENEANRQAFELSQNLYINGQTDFLNVISAQRAWLSSRESLVTTRQNIRKSVVQLAKALGGGW